MSAGEDGMSHDTHTCVGLLTWPAAWKPLQRQPTSLVFSEESPRQCMSATAPAPSWNLFQSPPSRIRILHCLKLHRVYYNRVALLDVFNFKKNWLRNHPYSELMGHRQFHP